jgi:hypothetical protein
MINDFKEYFRYRIYDNCRILVNNLDDVIHEVKTFVEKVIYPNISETNRIVIEGISLMNENNKITWNLVEPNEITNISTIRLDKDNILEIFDKETYAKDFDMNEGYPKVLYGLSFISFMETIAYFMIQDNLINEATNIFDICILSSNGVNNIVYEL